MYSHYFINGDIYFNVGTLFSPFTWTSSVAKKSIAMMIAADGEKDSGFTVDHSTDYRQRPALFNI